MDVDDDTGSGTPSEKDTIVNTMDSNAVPEPELLKERERLLATVLAQPNHETGWFRLAEVSQQLGRPGDAEYAASIACRLSPGKYARQILLAILFHNTGRSELALEQVYRAVSTVRSDRQRFNAMDVEALVLWALGHFELAEDRYHALHDRYPDNDAVRLQLSLLMLRRGQFERGWLEYASRPTPVVQEAISFEPRPMKTWQGEPLDGKTILLIHEQGLGDTIHFVRVAQELKKRWGCRVISTCPDSLIALTPCISGVDHWLKDGGVVQANVQCDMIDVVRILGLQSIPLSENYLSADPQLVKHWKKKITGYSGLKVGLVWQGNTKHPNDVRRSFKFSEFAPLWRLSGVTFFCLQWGVDAGQLSSQDVLEVVDLSPFDEENGRFMDTAAILTNLDLLITCDSSVNHLAGALGVRSFLALHVGSDWRWGADGEGTDWYPTMRLFRQSRQQEWHDVFDRMSEAICEEPGVGYRPAAEYLVGQEESRERYRFRYGTVILEGDDVETRSIRSAGEYAPFEMRLLQQLVRKGDRVVLVGQGIGSEAIAFSRLVGEFGDVMIFVDEKVNLALLKENLSLNHITNANVYPGDLPEKQIHKPELLSEDLWSVVRAADADLPDGGGIRLLKVNEGEDILQTLIRFDAWIVKHRPTLYLRADELGAAVSDRLRSLDYKLYRKTHRYSRSRNYMRNQSDLMRGSYTNVLGIHQHSTVKVEGMEEI